MLCVFVECKMNNRKAVAAYANKYPERDHPTKNAFTQLRQNLLDHGTFHKPSEYLRRTRPRAVTHEDAQADILGMIHANPKTSIRAIAQDMNISRSSVQRVLADKKFHPFKIFLTQQLAGNDFDRRLEFIAWYHAYKEIHPDVNKLILWTDESTFHNNGVVNRHNSHYWAAENPHWVKEQHVQQKFSVNVWCGVINETLVGPYFLEERLDGKSFLRFLRYRLQPFLEDVPLQIRQNMIFQLDGAPAHKFKPVATYLNNKFPDKWIGLNGPMKWPPRSPDLTPLDFFLWGYLKDVVYQEPIHNVAELEERIKEKCAAIPAAMIRRATVAVDQRFMACAFENGHQFEQNL